MTRTEEPADPSGLIGDEVQFRLLVDAVTDCAIFMLDPAGRITSWNAGARNIKGYEAQEVLGRHFGMFYTPEDRADEMPARALETANRVGRAELEGWRLRKDGSRFWASVVIVPIHTPTGALLGFAKVTRDMTERRSAQDALERTRQALFQSQKMEAVGQLTGGIAHDFNNLLTIITGSLELAVQRPGDAERVRRLIMNALSASERGARLTQQLLSFARRQSLRPEPSDINRLIISFESVLRRACGDTITFALDLDRALRPTMVDVPQFEAAMLNLVMNARDALPKGGTVTISTALVDLPEAAAQEFGVGHGAYVRITVADSGIGMSAETAARAFEPFFTTKPVGQGSGLGLSQVYGYVRQLNGGITIESALNQGTRVVLLLPAAAGNVAAVGGPPAPALAKVLVVEDDPDVLNLAVETLRGLDYEVLTAGDGPTALAMLRRTEDVDILFSDIVMPRGMSGVELAREASRIRPKLRVLLASGYAMPALLASQKAGSDFAFIGKPYRGAELARMLRSLAR